MIIGTVRLKKIKNKLTSYEKMKMSLSNLKQFFKENRQALTIKSVLAVCA